MTFNFDNSLLTDFAKCEACAVVKHVLGRQSKGKKLYADLGSAGHAALELHFRGQGRAAVLNKFEEEYDKVISIGTEPEKPEFAKENLKTILDVYCERRPVDAFPFEAVEFEKTVGVELAEGFKFWMKRDMLCRDKVSKMLYPVDHKFRFGQINEWWTKKFRLSSQFSGYIQGTSEMTGEICDRVYVNAVSFGKLPDSNRKCARHKVAYIECRRQHAEFELLVYTRTPEQLTKWRQDALFLAKQAKVYFEAYGSLQMLPYALRRGTFNESCTFCEFADWCRVGFAPEMIDEFTVEDRWAPWEGGDKKSWWYHPESDSVFYAYPPDFETFDGALCVEISELEAKERLEQQKEITSSSLVRWYWRAASDAIEADASGQTREANWQEIPEKMALKRLWAKGRDAWMKVWGEVPEAQEAMAQWARSQQGDK